MSSGVFRGKESSNRIELSQLVQDLLNFGVLGSLQLWGGDRWVGVSGGMEGVPTHMHMHAHACTCMHMHTCTCIHVQKLQMATNMEASMFIMFNIHVCIMRACHVHASTCMHAWDTPLDTPPPSSHPPPPRGDPRIQ